jgi:hypothetical protein
MNEFTEMFDREDIESELTPAVLAALDVLRSAGFAVAAFCPTELQDVPADRVEDSMVEAGWFAIDFLKD